VLEYCSVSGGGSPPAGSIGGALVGGLPDAKALLRVCHKLATSLPQKVKRIDKLRIRVLV